MCEPIRYRIRHDPQFRILYADTEGSVVEETLVGVKRGRSAVLRYLELDDSLPVFNVFIAPSRVELDRFVARLTPTPTAKRRLGMPQGADLYLLSPLAYPRDADGVVFLPDGTHDPDEYRRLLTHELVHMVEEAVSPRSAMEERPLWWAEGLAVEISGQHEEPEFRRRLGEALRRGPLPEPEELTGALAYVLGWTLVRFIEHCRGRAILRDVVLNAPGPQILARVFPDPAAEIAEWKTWATTLLP